MTSSQRPACRGGKVVLGEERSRRLRSTLTATLRQKVNSRCERADYQSLKWINRPSMILKECIAKSISSLKMVFGQKGCTIMWAEQIDQLTAQTCRISSFSVNGMCRILTGFFASLGCKKFKYQQRVFMKTDGDCVMIIKKSTTLLKMPPQFVTAREACGEAKQLHFSCQWRITILSHRSLTRVALKNMQLF